MNGSHSSGFKRGPTAAENIPVPTDNAPHPGIVAYEERTPPSENPFVDKRVPKGPVVEVAEEVAPNAEVKEDKGDARFWSAPVIAEVSCDSTDCTPVSIDEPADWALAAPWAANPARLVVCGAAVNGVTSAVAAAELAA
jgi:hypothetical protein